jgi:hypothetical protein
VLSAKLKEKNTTAGHFYHCREKSNVNGRTDLTPPPHPVKDMNFSERIERMTAYKDRSTNFVNFIHKDSREREDMREPRKP